MAHSCNSTAYMGNAVLQSEGSENWWVYWSHIRYFFYVYSYASGLLISKSLQNSVKQDPVFIHKVKEFLSAGLSDSPKNIFGRLGIDISDKRFWDKGLDEVESLLDDTEQLAKRLGKRSSGKPMLMVISAQAEPMIRPYYDSGQLQGLVTGLAGGKAYEEIINRPGAAGAVLLRPATQPMRRWIARQTVRSGRLGVLEGKSGLSRATLLPARPCLRASSSSCSYAESAR